MQLFGKIKDRLTESLEAAFGDAAEKENAEVVERLLESPKFQTLLRALMHIAEIVRIMEIKQNLFSKLNINEFDTSEEQLYQSYKDLIQQFKDAEQLLSAAIESKAATFSAISWNTATQRIDVPHLDENIAALNQIFRTQRIESKDFCDVSGLPLFVFDQGNEYCVQNYFRR